MKFILKQRFIQMVEALLARDKELNKTKIADAMGVSLAVLSNHLNPKRPIPEEFVEAFIGKFSLNGDFYATGKGDPLTDSVDADGNNLIAEHEPPYVKIKKGNPVDENTAQDGEIKVYGDLVQEDAAFTVNIPQFKDCAFGKMIYDHSMYPTIESGTYVFCKTVDDKTLIRYGQIYYIEADNYSFITRLQKGEKEGELLAVSDNDELGKDGTRRYESFHIPIDKIDRIFLVKGHYKQAQT